MFYTVAKQGGILLRFHWPDDIDLHFYLSELGSPVFILLMAKMNRLHGTPLLLHPTLRSEPNLFTKANVLELQQGWVK